MRLCSRVSGGPSPIPAGMTTAFRSANSSTCARKRPSHRAGLADRRERRPGGRLVGGTPPDRGGDDGRIGLGRAAAAGRAEGERGDAQCCEHRAHRTILAAMGLSGQRFAALAAVAVTLAASGCGGGSSTPDFPTLQAAQTYELADFQPSGSVRPNEPTEVSFTIDQPNGEPLTDYQGGDGPHTGVHLIFVRDDLSELVHHHPPVGPDGQVSEEVHVPVVGPLAARRGRLSEPGDERPAQLPALRGRRRRGRGRAAEEAAAVRADRDRGTATRSR